jgi:uncharacterized membrane protein YfbV (UPF0208 family)
MTAAAPLRGATEVELPPQLAAFLEELEVWALANRKDARAATWRYWALKAPAVLSSSTSGVSVLSHQPAVAAVAAAIASVCVLADGVYPGGQLRNAFIKAFHEIRALENQVANDWRIATLRESPSGRAAADILERAQSSYNKIADALRAAETTFASQQH